MTRRTQGRRRVLGALASVAVGLTAGCSGTGGDDGGTSDDDATTDDTLETPETTTAETTDTTTTQAASPELRRQARELTTLLADGEFQQVSESFVPEAQEQLPPERIRSAWETQTDGKGAYQGIASAERTTVRGQTAVVVRTTFESGALRVLWIFANGEPAGLFLRQPEGSYEPPAYVDRDAFEETDLTLSSPACDLGATLSLPTGSGGVPAVVLVHGTGPNDRDLTVGPNKPFRDLAWGLSSRGVGVLRYDKRTFACDVSRADPVTIDDVTTDDAVTAVDRLREHDRVTWVGVVGHSQGGLAAPRIVDRSGADGMALLAAPAGDLWRLVPQQVRHLAELDGTVTDAEARQIEQVEAAARRITDGAFEMDETLLNASGRYWESLRSYDQTAVAADLGVDAFAGQGGRDYQVPPEDLDDWRGALGEDATYREYPALDHLLFPGEGESSPEEYVRPNSVARPVVEDLAEWVGGR